MMYKRLVTILIPILPALLFPLVALAGEPPRALTLEESIAIALRENLSIRSAREGLRVSEARKKEAFTEFLPKLSTTYNYTHNDPAAYIKQPPPSPVNTLTVATQDNYIWSLEVKQPVFTGGRISGNYEITSLGEKAARMDELTTVQNIVAQVTATYFDILKSRRLRKVADQSVELLAAQLDLAKNFHEVGLIPRNEVLQSEVRLANGRQLLVRAENSVELARARFNTILRRPSTSPVDVEDILKYAPYEKSLEECLAAARDKRPELEASAVRHEQAKKKVQVVESDFYPSVNLVGSYQRYGDSADLNGSPYRDPDNWSVAAMASWDFWEWGRTKHAGDAARGQAEQARISLEDVKDQVALEVEQAFLVLRENEKRIALAGKAVEQAEENYRINEERYRLQVSRMTDLLDAETLLTTSRAEYAVALGDYQIAKAALERAMGVNWRPGNQGEGRKSTGQGRQEPGTEGARAEND